MRKKKRSSTLKLKDVPPEYWASKKKWEKTRKTIRYQRIWKKFSESLKTAPLRAGKCDIPPAIMFKKYGIHRPIDPNGQYPPPDEICIHVPFLKEVKPSAWVISPNIRPIEKPDGKFYGRINPQFDQDGEVQEQLSLEFKDLYEGYPLEELNQELQELKLKIDLTRDKKTVIHDFTKLLGYYSRLRDYLGVKNKQVRFNGKKNKIKQGHVSRQEKLVYATFLLNNVLKLSLREIACLPKSLAMVRTALVKFRSWDSTKKEELGSYFRKLFPARQYCSDKLRNKRPFYTRQDTKNDQ